MSFTRLFQSYTGYMGKKDSNNVCFWLSDSCGKQRPDMLHPNELERGLCFQLWGFGITVVPEEAEAGVPGPGPSMLLRFSENATPTR